MSQGIGVEQLEETLIGAAGAVGVGLPRRGLDGARASMLDAERSVELAEALGAPLVVFERDWLRATLYAEREYLRPLLDRAIATCTEHPHIAEAALAFSAGGLSQSEAARRLHLRPSSLNYRLQRWNELSGDDLASPEGLACVAVASLCGDDRKMRDFR